MEDSSDASMLADVGEVKSPIERQSSADEPESVSNDASPEVIASSDSNEPSDNSPSSPCEPNSVSQPDSPQPEVRSESKADIEAEVEPEVKPEIQNMETSTSGDKKLGSLGGDVISEDENFKDNEDGELEEGEHKDDDELDFEEGEQTNSPKQSKKDEENEDGEVESEDELEEGEVKEDDDEDTAGNSATQGNINPSVCRFYHKGLCTWGSSCRFIHNDPPNGNLKQFSFYIWILNETEHSFFLLFSSQLQHFKSLTTRSQIV
jgi:hypothetical protein